MIASTGVQNIKNHLVKCVYVLSFFTRTVSFMVSRWIRNCFSVTSGNACHSSWSSSSSFDVIFAFSSFWTSLIHLITTKGLYLISMVLMHPEQRLWLLSKRSTSYNERLHRPSRYDSSTRPRPLLRSMWLVQWWCFIAD